MPNLIDAVINSTPYGEPVHTKATVEEAKKKHLPSIVDSFEIEGTTCKGKVLEMPFTIILSK